MPKLSVLVVDDEDGIREGVARVLARFRPSLAEVEGELSFDIAEAGSGEDALASLAAAPADIVLLDHKLPGMSGLQVLEAMRERPGDTLVVMITAYATIDTAVAATKRGAHDFLAKPFTPEELKSCVYKAAKQLVLQREARRLAAEKRQVRFQFVSVLAHELKSPLAAVEGYLNLLHDGVVEPGSVKHQEVLARSLERIAGMRTLIADLLDLTGIESGQRRREPAPVDLVAIAGRAIETVGTAAARRRITLSLDAPDALVACADAAELEIILNNLVSNAVKYNRDGGRVEVALARDGDFLVIRVSDTGIGLSQKETALLFREFVRIKNDRTRGIVGTGLGLSIVDKLAASYGGDVRVESEPEVGSTFIVRLRLAPGEQG